MVRAGLMSLSDHSSLTPSDPPLASLSLSSTRFFRLLSKYFHFITSKPLYSARTFVPLAPAADKAADVCVQECECLGQQSAHITQPEHEDGQPEHSVHHGGDLAPHGFGCDVTVT